MGGACKNIISPSELVFIPPATTLASEIPGIVNFQPPFVVQTAIDAGLKKKLDAVQFLPEECHFALRKYFCGQYFNKNTIITLGDAMKATYHQHDL